MRNLVVAACLVLGISLLGGAVPVAKVQPMSPGTFWVWIQNTEACAFDNFKVVFVPTGIKVSALVINGPTVKSVDVKSNVVTVTLNGGLKTGGWLVLGVTGVPANFTADNLLKYKEAFTIPPRCR